HAADGHRCGVYKHICCVYNISITSRSGDERMPGATKEQSLQAQPVPLSEFPRGARRDVVAVLTDIDDTLTEAGRLPTASYSAMERLRAAGLLVIPVTGRSAGWCDLIARQWPVD